MSEFIHVGLGDHVTDAEVSLVRGIIEEPSSIAVVRFLVEPADFKNEILGAVYAGFLKIDAAGMEINATTIKTMMDHDAAKAADDTMFSVSFVRDPADTYAEIVKQASMRRRLLAHAKRFVRMCEPEERVEVSDIIDATTRGLYEISAGIHNADLASQAEVSRAFQKSLEAIKNGEHEFGCPTGLEAFDAVTQGLCPESVYVIAARPSVGKTGMMLQLVTGVCRLKRAALIESLEMSYERLFEREFSAASGIPMNRLRVKEPFNEDEMFRVGRGYDAVLPYRITYGRSRTVDQIRRDCLKLKQRNNLDALFVDYIGLMKPSAKSYSREREVADFSAGLKDISRELKIPVVILSQLNRESVETEEPSLNELRESGAIEQDADVIMMLWGARDAKEVNWKIDKNRNGTIARGLYKYHRATQRINEFRIAETTSFGGKGKKNGNA